MSTLGALVHAGLKSNFGMAILYHRLFREKKDRWLVPLIGFSLLGIVPMLLGLVHFIRDMYVVLAPMHQERAILGLGVLAGRSNRISGSTTSFGVLFSRDLEMLIPLPVRPSGPSSRFVVQWS
jgi:hypothetical protein